MNGFHDVLTELRRRHVLPVAGPNIVANPIVIQVTPHGPKVYRIKQ